MKRNTIGGWIAASVLISCEAAVYVEPVEQSRDASSPSSMLTVRVIGDGGGVVISNPIGIECGNDCAVDDQRRFL